MKEDIKYAGIDLHQSTCLVAVHDGHGKVLSESILKTEAETLRSFFRGSVVRFMLRLKLERSRPGCMRF
jgi:hypothetical protein